MFILRTTRNTGFYSTNTEEGYLLLEMVLFNVFDLNGNKIAAITLEGDEESETKDNLEFGYSGYLYGVGNLPRYPTLQKLLDDLP